MRFRIKATLVAGIALGIGALVLFKGPREVPTVKGPAPEENGVGNLQDARLEGPVADVAHRVALPGPEGLELAVLVQEEPDGPRSPLESGKIRLGSGARTLELPVVGGNTTLPSDWAVLRGDEPLSVEDDSGKRLYACLDVNSAMVRCYGYPGVFVHVGGGPASSALRAAKYSGDPNLSSAFKVPPSEEHIAPLHVDGARPAFVQALSEGETFYMLRPEGGAWIRVDARDAPVGSTIMTSLTACGSVTFSAPGVALERTPRLVVHTADGEAVMQPRFAPRVQQAMVDGWPTGEYEAYLTLAPTDSPRFAVTERVPFEVLPGQGTHVEIKAPEGSTAEGYLVGVLHFEAWELVEPWFQEFGLRLIIEPVEGVNTAAFNAVPRRDRILPTQLMEQLPTQVSGSPAWAWDAGAYPVGAYRMSIEPLRTWIHFSVESGKTTSINDPVPVLAVTVLEFGGEAPKQDPALMLSYPKGWSHYPQKNDAPRLLKGEDGTRKLISEPGEYSLGFLWGTQWFEQELVLEPGWNTAYFNTGGIATATLELVDGAGDLLELERADWSGLSIRSKVSGEPVTVMPMHVRVHGRGSWTRALVDVSDGQNVIIDGLAKLGFGPEPVEVELKDGETTRLRKE